MPGDQNTYTPRPRTPNTQFRDSATKPQTPQKSKAYTHYANPHHAPVDDYDKV